MWLFLLYGLAAVWALKTLTSLMIQHKKLFGLKLEQQLKNELNKQKDASAEQDVLAAIDQKNAELDQQRGPKAA